MRHILIYVLTAILCHFTEGFSATNTEDAAHQENKTYISADQLSIQDEGMLVYLEDTWFQIDSLFTDENGLFFKECGRKDDHHCPKGYVSCRNCHKCVPECYDICPICGKAV